MKKSIHIAYLLIYLISFQLQAQGQTMPSSCGGSRVRYGVSGMPNSVFQWNVTGGSFVNYNDSIDVTWDPNTTIGIITVTEHSAFGCIAAPYITNVTLNNPTLSLDKQLSICQGNTTNITPVGTFTNFLWSNGATTQTITASQEGWYKVKASDSNGCQAKDSVYLTVSPRPNVNLGNDTVLCGPVMTLYAGNDGTSYLWSTGERSNSIMVSKTGDGQSFWVEVQNDLGCITRDTIKIHSCGIVTNTITPNGDGWNDTWKVEKYMVSYINIEIFDRWGRMVFQAPNGLPANGWDGTSKGRPLPMDSYYYIAKYNDGSNKTEQGTITIIR